VLTGKGIGGSNTSVIIAQGCQLEPWLVECTQLCFGRWLSGCYVWEGLGGVGRRATCPAPAHAALGLLAIRLTGCCLWLCWGGWGRVSPLGGQCAERARQLCSICPDPRFTGGRCAGCPAQLNMMHAVRGRACRVSSLSCRAVRARPWPCGWSCCCPRCCHHHRCGWIIGTGSAWALPGSQQLESDKVPQPPFSAGQSAWLRPGQ